MRFTVYVERDIAINVRDDRCAAQVADLLDSRVDEAIRSIRDETELVAAHTTCHRGERNKMVYDSKDPSVR